MLVHQRVNHLVNHDHSVIVITTIWQELVIIGIDAGGIL